MEIVLSEATTIAEKKKIRPTGADDLNTFCGAVFLPPDNLRRLPGRYELVNDMDQLVECGGSVLGTTEALIFDQLLQKHPSPSIHAGYVQEWSGFIDSNEDGVKPGCRRRRRRYSSDYDKKLFKGWLLWDQLYTEEEDMDVLADLIREHGPICISEKVWEELGRTEGLRDIGYTCVPRRFERYQINHNPRTARLYGYRQAVRAYEHRANGEFGLGAISAIYHLLRPQNDSTFWNITVRVEDSSRPTVNGVLELLKINQCLNPGTRFWRTNSARNYADVQCGRGWRHRRGGERDDYLTFREAVEQCLQFLHAEEARIEDEDKKNSPMYGFCRFIRREAKALGLKIPRKPKEPKKPKPRRKKRRCKSSR